MSILTKVYLYQRFSSKGQEGGSSLYRQGEAQKSWLLKNQDWAVEAGLYEDKAMSGRTGEHLKGSLGLLVDDIETGLVERGSIVLVERFSRLSRMKVSETQELLRRIWKAGVTIVTAKDDARYGPKGEDDLGIQVKLLVEIHGAFAESQNRSERVLGSYNKRRDEARKGVTPNLRKPFWLNKNGKLNTNSQVIKDMFELYVSGNGQRNILRILKERYPEIKRVREMNPATVMKWLTSDVVLGYWWINKVERYKVYDAAVDEALFYKVQSIHKNKLHKNVNPKREWHISGLVQCGHCGKGCSIQKSKHSWPVLRCSHKQRMGGDACQSKGTYPYLIPYYFFRSHLEHFYLGHLLQNTQSKEAKGTISMLDFEITKMNEKIDLLQSKLVESENSLMDSIFKMLSKASQTLDGLKKERDEALLLVSGKNIFDLQKIEEITKDAKKFNLMCQQLGYKMVLKEDEVYVDHEDVRKSIKYLRFSRKEEAYIIEKNFADMGDLYNDNVQIYVGDKLLNDQEADELFMDKGEITQLDAKVKAIVYLYPKQVVIN
ncbi:recombinase family protein [Shewanella abyssi]|uniref:recombinase family protein n=1 Tax=Shewanella abyssi TaxID=311789 RepID=UPI00200CBADC|nr:recombinase family protein [Shewanella abyssi]MCL1049850.1 recombinase family protein [Shewanella abyssi]